MNERLQFGAEYLLKGDYAETAGNTLTLNPPTGGYSWGIWGFAPEEETLESIRASFTVSEGAEVYIALSDYSKNKWDIRGPLTESTEFSLSDEANLSGGGATFIAVIAIGTAPAHVSRLTLSTDLKGWQVLIVDSENKTGYTPSLAVIAGNPAIAFRSYDNTDTICSLRYVRCRTALGYEPSDWIEPVDIGLLNISNSHEPSNNCALAEIGGLPAVSWISVDEDRVWYSRAQSNTGMEPFDWLFAGGKGDPGNPRIFQYVNLFENKGNPSISVYDHEIGDLMYCYDIEGAEYSLIVIDKEFWDDDGQPHSMMLVDGQPAVVYADRWNNTLKYARSSTPSGGAASHWDHVEIIQNVLVDSVSMTTVLNTPAIAYWDRTNGNLKYMRATSSTGEGSWPETPVTVDSTTNTGSFCGLMVFDGKPAVAYSNWLVDNNLYFKNSATATGSTEDSWGDKAADVLYTNSAESISMVEVNGQPAMAWHDTINDDLMYAVYLD